MSLIALVGIFAASLAVLYVGATTLIASAKRLGESLGLSAFTIGVIILGFGTSLPELVSAIMAHVQGVGELVPAHTLGANVANVFFIVSFIAVISRTFSFTFDDKGFEVGWLLTAGALLVATYMNGVVSSAEAIFLFTALLFYIMAVIVVTKDNPAQVERGKFRVRDMLLVCIGFVLLVVGAKYAVTSASDMAALFGISAGIIGLLGLALGTTLPELFVAWRAYRDGEPHLVIGNASGSIIFNTFAMLGIAGSLEPLAVDATTRHVGLWFLAGAIITLVGVMLSGKMSRAIGAVGLVLYVAFAFLVLRALL